MTPSYCTQNKRSRLEEFAKSASNTTFGKLAGLWGNQQRERYTIEKPLFATPLINLFYFSSSPSSPLPGARS